MSDTKVLTDKRVYQYATRELLRITDNSKSKCAGTLTPGTIKIRTVDEDTTGLSLVERLFRPLIVPTQFCTVLIGRARNFVRNAAACRTIPPPSGTRTPSGR